MGVQHTPPIAGQEPRNLSAVGGGNDGCGIARDAAGHGLSVAPVRTRTLRRLGTTMAQHDIFAARAAV